MTNNNNTEISVLLPDGSRDAVTDFKNVPDSFYSILSFLEPVCGIVNKEGNIITVKHPGYCHAEDRLPNSPESNPYVDIRSYVQKPLREDKFDLSEGLNGHCCESCLFEKCPYLAAAMYRNIRAQRPKMLSMSRKLYAENKTEADKTFFARPTAEFKTFPRHISVSSLLKAQALIDKGLIMSCEKNGKYVVSMVIPGDGGMDVGKCLEPNPSKTFSVSTLITPIEYVDDMLNNPHLPDQTSVAVYAEWLIRNGWFEQVLNQVANKETDEISRNANKIASYSSSPEIVERRILYPDTFGFYACVETSGSPKDKELLNDLTGILNKVRETSGTDDDMYTEVSLLELSEMLTKKRMTSGQDTYIEFGYDFNHLVDNRIYVLTNLDEFMNHYDFFNDRPEVEYRERSLKYLISELNKYGPEKYIILYDSKAAIERFLKTDKHLALLFRENVFTVKDISNEEILNLYLENLDPYVYEEYHDGFDNKFFDYVKRNRETFNMPGEDLACYLAGYANAQIALKLPPEPNLRESSFNLDKAMKDIIDMKQIKEQIRNLYSYATFTLKASSSSLKLPDPNYHMVFTGNPGTGKTMIARIIARMLYEIGITKSDKLVEVERKDLVAEYVGQTAVKTSKVIELAMGGVLFIDEAYSLNGTGSGTAGDAFGREAVATLIKAMEDRKGEFVVIFAGYKAEMDGFLAMNPGIESRIGYSFTFEDYSADALTDIFKSKIKASGFKLKQGTSARAKKLFSYFCNLENFGNGRFVDKVIQNSLIIHSQHTEEEIDYLYPDDIPSVSAMADIMMHGNAMADPKDLSKEDILTTAIHEIGHAYTEYILTGGTDISLVKVTPEANGALGYVMRKSKKRKYHVTEKDMMNELAVLLAGKNAERLFYGTHSSGCSSDIQKANEMAKNMAEKFAMPAVTENKPEDILKQADQLSMQTLEDGKSIIKASADWLAKVKQCSGDEMLQKFKELS